MGQPNKGSHTRTMTNTLHPPFSFSVPRAATYIGVSKSFLYRLLIEGAIPCSRIGRKVVIERGALEKFIIERRQNRAEMGSENRSSSRPT